MAREPLRVYIAGPITKGDLRFNIHRAETMFYRLLKAGFAPFCPHWSCYASGPLLTPDGRVYAIAAAVHPGTSHADWVALDLAWVRVADAVLRLPGESTGADAEVAEARRVGVPVFGSFEEVLAWGESHKG